MTRFRVADNKRIVFVFAVIVLTAVTFWSGSRYPSLDEKAIMGGSAALEDPLSFEASIQIQPGRDQAGPEPDLHSAAGTPAVALGVPPGAHADL